MKTIEATPTEYKGVRFRSKCEAMFAMHLDLELAERGVAQQSQQSQADKIVSCGIGGFQYEPKTLVDGWNPDFLTWEPCAPSGYIADGFFHHVPTLEMRFIEYKPSVPTVAYIEKFMKGFSRWQDMASRQSSEHAYRTVASIFYGSPYTKNRSSGVGEIDVMCGDPFDTHEDWGANTFEEILSYRFDLVQPCHG